MEEIVTGKKNFPVGEKIEKKKIVFFNSKGEILIYEGDNGIIIPSISSDSKSTVQTLIHEKTGICIEEDFLQELVRFIHYYEQYDRTNDKLRKITIKRITEYYAYYISFNSHLIASIVQNTSDLNLKPYLVSISDFLHNNVSNHPSQLRHKLAVEELDKRLRYVKY